VEHAQFLKPLIPCSEYFNGDFHPMRLKFTFASNINTVTPRNCFQPMYWRLLWLQC